MNIKKNKSPPNIPSIIWYLEKSPNDETYTEIDESYIKGDYYPINRRGLKKRLVEKFIILGVEHYGF